MRSCRRGPTSSCVRGPSIGAAQEATVKSRTPIVFLHPIRPRASRARGQSCQPARQPHGRVRRSRPRRQAPRDLHAARARTEAGPRPGRPGGLGDRVRAERDAGGRQATRCGAAWSAKRPRPPTSRRSSGRCDPMRSTPSCCSLRRSASTTRPSPFGWPSGRPACAGAPQGLGRAGGAVLVRLRPLPDRRRRRPLRRQHPRRHGSEGAGGPGDPGRPARRSTSQPHADSASRSPSG